MRNRLFLLFVFWACTVWPSLGVAWPPDPNDTRLFTLVKGVERVSGYAGSQSIRIIGVIFNGRIDVDYRLTINYSTSAVQIASLNQCSQMALLAMSNPDKYSMAVFFTDVNILDVAGGQVVSYNTTATNTAFHCSLTLK